MYGKRESKESEQLDDDDDDDDEQYRIGIVM